MPGMPGSKSNSVEADGDQVTYKATVIADSIANGVRLVTMEVTFPRIVLAEFNTHRVFSRNSASSRAIPVAKRVAAVRANPFVPAAFAANKSGMQAGEEFDAEENALIQARWLKLGEYLAQEAEWFAERKVHKQWANRITELHGWHTVVVTSTEWDNFYALRCNPMAAPEIHTIADMMKLAMESSTPKNLDIGDWHLPYVTEILEHGMGVGDNGDNGIYLGSAPKVSSARCARVSYLTQDGKRDINADLGLHDRLLEAGHMSPFEHAAKVGNDQDIIEATDGMVAGDGDGCAGDPRQFIGNFRAPWIQYRKGLPNEAVFKAPRA